MSRFGVNRREHALAGRQGGQTPGDVLVTGW
jgi:hypothetical protein